MAACVVPPPMATLSPANPNDCCTPAILVSPVPPLTTATVPVIFAAFKAEVHVIVPAPVEVKNCPLVPSVFG